MNAKLSLDIIMSSFKKCFSRIIPCSLCCSFTKIYVDGFVVGRDIPHVSVLTAQTRIVLSLDLEFIASAITVCKSRHGYVPSDGN